jgi:hypothetical protein
MELPKRKRLARSDAETSASRQCRSEMSIAGRPDFASGISGIAELRDAVTFTQQSRRR